MSFITLYMIEIIHSIDNDFTLVGKIYMYMTRKHWAKIKVKKMKRQNKTSKYRVFLFIVKRKKEIFKPFHQNKFSTELIKTVSYLKRRNISRREFIGTCKYSILKIQNGGSPRYM